MIDFSGLSNTRSVGRLLRQFLRLIPNGCTMRVLQGELRGMRWTAGAATHGCWLGSYELSKQTKIASSLDDGCIFFDVGANVGFYTLLGSKCVGDQGQVFAFEPLPSNIRHLERHIELNSLQNVKVIKAAVSDQAGEGFFDEGSDSHMGKLSDQGKVNVNIVSLDGLLGEGVVPVPDFIKIDVEGAELSVLHGARKLLAERKPTLFLATHGKSIHDDCLSFLQSLGYSCCPIEPHLSIDDCDEIVATNCQQ